MSHVHTESDSMTTGLPNPDIYEFSKPSRIVYNLKSRTNIKNTKNFKTIVNGIWEYIEKNRIEILSLDVFDTYLLRNNKPEALRYMEMSQIILKEINKKFPNNKKIENLTAEDICETRIASMHATYRTRPLTQGCGEGLVHEVYAMQSMMLGLPDEAKDIFFDVEINYEIKNLTINPVFEMISKMMKDAGKMVILVSDMYLPAIMIEKIILGVSGGGERMYNKIFSSADLVISKRCGKIFPYLEKELHADGKNFFHLGDSWVGDVSRPRQAGWHAMYFPVSKNELVLRTRNLKKFISAMDEQGIDTRSWAKL